MRRARIRLRSLAAVTSLALSLSLLPLTGATAAQGPDVTVSSVGGQPVTADGTVKQPLSGTVDVAGTARTGAPGQPAEPTPLHADAGDSPFVTAGDKAPLLGSRRPTDAGGQSRLRLVLAGPFLGGRRRR